MYFNECSVELGPKIVFIEIRFSWGGGGGGGGGEVKLPAFIFLMLISETCFAGSFLIMIRQNSGPN